MAPGFPRTLLSSCWLGMSSPAAWPWSCWDAGLLLRAAGRAIEPPRATVFHPQRIPGLPLRILGYGASRGVLEDQSQQLGMILAELFVLQARGHQEEIATANFLMPNGRSFASTDPALRYGRAPPQHEVIAAKATELKRTPHAPIGMPGRCCRAWKTVLYLCPGTAPCRYGDTMLVWWHDPPSEARNAGHASETGGERQH